MTIGSYDSNYPSDLQPSAQDKPTVRAEEDYSTSSRQLAREAITEDPSIAPRSAPLAADLGPWLVDGLPKPSDAPSQLPAMPDPFPVLPGDKQNPKQAFGVRKVPASVVPRGVIAEVSIGMLEGAIKYRRHNYRVIGSIKASTYYDSTMRHIDAWWEGQDLDPESAANLHHISKAISSLTVLRDAMLSGTFEDDRPPATYPENWLDELNKKAAALIDAREAAEPCTQLNRGE